MGMDGEENEGVSKTPEGLVPHVQLFCTDITV
jgi:hypothetical protein